MAKKTLKNSCLDCRWAYWNLLKLQGYGTCSFPVELLVFPKAYPVDLERLGLMGGIQKDSPHTDCPCHQMKGKQHGPKT